MFCKDCLENSISKKLLPNDINVLEYLLHNNAIISQCAISREIIKEETELSVYKCYTALERLECFNLVEKQNKSNSSKYCITEDGKFILNLIENKINGGVNV